jgi:hypothetical protein
MAELLFSRADSYQAPTVIEAANDQADTANLKILRKPVMTTLIQG